MKRIFQYCLLVTLLTGCSHAVHHPDKTPAKNEDKTHEARVATLSGVKSWNLRGQIGVNDGKEAWSAQVFWKQRGNQYTLQLFGPFAGGTVKVIGRPGRVELFDASNKRTTAASSDALFAQQTGYQLPLSNLIYWIKAMPAPGKPAAKQFDQYNHLTQLDQQGWKINYLRYTSDDGIDLPSKMTMVSPDLKIKMVISQWRLLKL